MLDLVQGSAQWLAARAGSLGASQVADALAKTKSGWGASRANIKAQLVTERLTGVATESYCSPAMQRGKDLEPQARARYGFERDVDVADVGMVLHPVIAHTHCSPDGLVSDDGLVELKCCGAARHIELLDGSEPEARYVTQCLWQMACTGREWVDLAYFHPDLPLPMQLHVLRIERDDAAIAEMEDAVAAFLAEVAEQIDRLKARYLVEGIAW